MSNNKEHYHNKGEKEGSENIYNPPHSASDYLMASFFYCEEVYNRICEENEAYDIGYENGRKQR